MLGAFARLFRTAPPEPRWLDVATLRKQLTGEPAPLVVDVRGADEFVGPLGHIEGALNVPLPELAARQNEITASGRPVVCVCLTDKRSATAASTLVGNGLPNVVVLRGGMKAWREAGL
jgi:rhodanese-related sulfurtransferase